MMGLNFVKVDGKCVRVHVSGHLCLRVCVFEFNWGVKEN